MLSLHGRLGRPALLYRPRVRSRSKAVATVATATAPEPRTPDADFLEKARLIAKFFDERAAAAHTKTKAKVFDLVDIELDEISLVPEWAAANPYCKVILLRHGETYFHRVRP